MSTINDLIQKCHDLERQRDAAVSALIAIKQDLQCNGECLKTDEFRINRINEGIDAAGDDPADSDME